MTETAATATQPLTPHQRQIAGLRRGGFVKGQSGNPAGRPLGSRQVITEKFVRCLAADFTKHGKSVIAAVRKRDPSTYLRVIAGLLPAKVDLDLNTNGNAGARTLEQVEADIAARIEARARELAQQLTDQRLTVLTVAQPVDNPVDKSPVLLSVDKSAP